MKNQVLASFDIPDIVKSQKLGWPVIGKNSMSPENKEEFEPPSVNVPPGATAPCTPVLPGARSKKKENSGLLNWLPLARVCQNGVAPVAAIGVKPRPIIPDTVPSIGACCI